ncbi:MAG: alpha-isopropylmalate synthase regulatory domain-containing protein [Actinomycetota bacterium]
MNKNNPGFFDVVGYTVTSGRARSAPSFSEATVEVRVGSRRVARSASGVGPVHALDAALRGCLAADFPELENVRLCDYQVSVLEGQDGTSAEVRVIIQATDGVSKWDAGSVSQNIIDASFEALCSAAVMGILRAQQAARLPA